MSNHFVLRLKALLRPSAFAALMAEFGGTAIYLPSTSSIAANERDRAIATAWRAGASVALLAQEYGLTKPHVRRIIRRSRGRTP